MRILLMTYGTRGDVEPFALARRLCGIADRTGKGATRASTGLPQLRRA